MSTTQNPQPNEAQTGAPTTNTASTVGAQVVTPANATTPATETQTTTTNPTNVVTQANATNDKTYVNHVDVVGLKANLSKIKNDTGYDLSLDEATGHITLHRKNNENYSPDAVKQALRPFIEKGKDTSISIVYEQGVNADKLRINDNYNKYHATTTNKNVKLARMQEQLLNKIPDMDEFQKIHMKAMIDRLKNIDESDRIFENLAESLGIVADKEQILQYMNKNIQTEKVRLALAELNYGNRNIFNSEKQDLENELQARGITRKELGKLSDEEMSDIRNLNKIQQTISQSEQQIKKEMREIRKRVRAGLFGWIRDLFHCYGSEYEAQEKLLKQMREQKNKAHSNVLKSAENANTIFARKTISRQTSRDVIDQRSEAIVDSNQNVISTDINLLGIGQAEQGFAPSSGTEGISNAAEESYRRGIL